MDNLIEELINDVKKEQNPNNQHIMINKIKKHFNIHNDDFCLDNISNIQIKKIKEINDFTTETQFYNLFVSLDEERLDSFNNKLKSL